MHYAHKHTVTVLTESRCDPCDCYVCTLSADERAGVREWYRTWTESAVERVLEEIETQLRRDGETAVMKAWNSLTGWKRGNHRDVWPVPGTALALGEVMISRPSLLGVVRGVFRSLDRHGLIQPARVDSAGRRALAWKEATRGKINSTA